MDRNAKTVRVGDLMGVAEIAIEAGVGPNAVTNWRERYEDFPAPLVLLHCGPVFDWQEVHTWLVDTGRI